MSQHDRLFVDHQGRVHLRPDTHRCRTRRGVHVAIRYGDDLLLVRPPGANWLELPGGGLEDGESVETAAARELLEEGGVVLSEDALAEADEERMQTRYYARNHDQYWLYSQCFRLVSLAARPTEQPPLETGHERVWTPLQELQDAPLHHVHRQGLDRLLGLVG